MDYAKEGEAARPERSWGDEVSVLALAAALFSGLLGAFDRREYLTPAEYSFAGPTLRASSLLERISTPPGNYGDAAGAVRGLKS